MQIGIDDFNIGIVDNISCKNFAFALGVDDYMHAAAFAEQSHTKFLNVKDDFCNVFLNAGNGRKLVKHTVNLDGRSSRARH